MNAKRHGFLEQAAENLCRCGSGRRRYELVDAAGIFCAFVCEKCEAEVRKRYNPAIFNQGTIYSATGEEEDIGLSEDLWAERLYGEFH